MIEIWSGGRNRVISLGWTSTLNIRKKCIWLWGMNRRSEKSSRGVKSKSSIPIIDKEPPPNLLPSKHEFPKLLLVLSVASLVAWSSNLLFTSLLHPSTKPFCDNNSLDSNFPGQSLSPNFNFLALHLYLQPHTF